MDQKYWRGDAEGLKGNGNGCEWKSSTNLDNIVDSQSCILNGRLSQGSRQIVVLAAVMNRVKPLKSVVKKKNMSAQHTQKKPAS